MRIGLVTTNSSGQHHPDVSTRPDHRACGTRPPPSAVTIAVAHEGGDSTPLAADSDRGQPAASFLDPTTDPAAIMISWSCCAYLVVELPLASATLIAQVLGCSCPVQSSRQPTWCWTTDYWTVRLLTKPNRSPG